MELSAAASLSYQSQEKLGLVIWKTSIIVLRTCVWQRGKQSKQSTQKSGPGETFKIIPHRTRNQRHQ